MTLSERQQDLADRLAKAILRREYRMARYLKGQANLVWPGKYLDIIDAVSAKVKARGKE